MSDFTFKKQKCAIGQSFFITVLFTFLFNANAFAASYSGGAGTNANPYKLSTVADIVTLSKTSSDWSKSFELTQNINMSGKTISPIGYGYADAAVTDEADYFSGNFNGAGFTISNFTIDDPHTEICTSGFFGEVRAKKKTCTIQKLTLKNVSTTNASIARLNFGNLIGRAITSSAGIVKVTDCHVVTDMSVCGAELGGLIGSTCTMYDYAAGEDDEDSSGSINITSCSYTGTMTIVYGVSSANSSHGGLIGRIWARGGTTNVTSCTSDVTITEAEAATYVGGFIGDVYYLSASTTPEYNIDACSSVATITTKGSSIGGFVGYTSGPTIITNSNANVDITYNGSAKRIGGFGGHLDGFIESCYSTGTLKACGGFRIGGFMGQGQAECCYSLVDITLTGDASSIGGFAGYFGCNSISRSSCDGTISYDNGVSINRVGGFVGEAYCDGYNGTIIDCYTMIDNVSGNKNIGGFAGYCFGMTDDQAGTLKMIRNYSKASVSGTTNVGAFAGYAESDWATDIYFTNCYYNRTLSSLSVIGYSQGTISGTPFGLSTANMTSGLSKFSGFSRSGNWFYSPSKNDSYPYIDEDCNGMANNSSITANNDEFIFKGCEGTTLSENVGTNDVFTSGSATLNVTTSPTHGTLTSFNTSTGAFVYKPTNAETYEGDDTFYISNNRRFSNCIGNSNHSLRSRFGWRWRM